MASDYSGTILFGSKDAKKLNVEKTQQQISYIEQDVYLFNATIRDNITLGDDFTDIQLAEAVKNSALSADLEHMPDGLDTMAGENGSSLRRSEAACRYSKSSDSWMPASSSR